LPRNEALVGTHISRPESPEIEMLYQEAIGAALINLLAEKGLYQNVDLVLDHVISFLSRTKHSDLAAIQTEFSRRPWVPITPGLPQDNHMRAEFFCGVGDSPLSAPSSDLKLSFPLPAFKCFCPNCKDEHTYSSIGVLWADGFMDYYPKMSEKTEQLFNLHYVCGVCKDNVIGFLVRRKGTRLTLCGRTQRLHIDVPVAIPKKLRNIVSDAISASNENDVYGGFYHLRTFCEHYMKSCLNVAVEEKISGEELCSQYNSSLDTRMSSGLPAMSVIYESASKLMHSRAGGHDDFSALLSQIEGHLTAKDLFTKYASS